MSRATRATLAGAAALVLTAGTAGLVVALGSPAQAASAPGAADQAMSSAFGLESTGKSTETIGPLAAVSSSGAVQHGSVASFRSPSGAVVATGIETSAGAGTATAKVADLQVGSDLGSFEADCIGGVITTHFSQSNPNPGKRLHVSENSGGTGTLIAATVTLTATGGDGEILAVASVTCAQAQVPPPPSSTSNPPPTSSSVVVAPPPPPPSTGRNTPGTSSAAPPPPAPAPQPHPGQFTATG